MFGYLKPDKENLYVKELHLYKSVYCGLCSTIKSKVSFLLPLTLSYDFVFFTMVRATLLKEKGVVEKGRCEYNHFKKVTYCIPKGSALYSARIALILTLLKVRDDLWDSDTFFCKKALIFPLYLHLKSKVKKLSKKVPELLKLISIIKIKLDEISVLEKEKSTDIDRLCALFGDIMAEILAFSLDEKSRKIALALGSAIGNYIYLIDAIDDAKKDEKYKSYNPLLEKYGNADKVAECAKELDCVLSAHTNNAVLAFNLLDTWEYHGVISNILTLGLGKESYRIFTKNGGKNDRPL